METLYIFLREKKLPLRGGQRYLTPFPSIRIPWKNLLSCRSVG